MFPELEKLIEHYRKLHDPKVLTLLCMLSKAERASWDGDNEKAKWIVKRAMRI